MSEVDFEQDRLVLWTDGSRFDDCSCGIGLAYRSSTVAWTILSWSAPKSIKTHVLEVYAISKGLEIAWERFQDMGMEQKPSSVCIYSDCPGALEYFSRLRQTLTGLKELPYGEELVGPGIIAAERLSVLKVAIKLHYVPGHSSIEGNTRREIFHRKMTSGNVNDCRGSQRGTELMGQIGVGGKRIPLNDDVVLCSRSAISPEKHHIILPLPERTTVRTIDGLVSNVSLARSDLPIPTFI